MKLVPFFLLLLGLTAVPAGAVLIHVPADEPTIQDGLSAAIIGDTVLVAAGTYYEHHLMPGYGVHLLSETGEPDCVTVDGEGLGRVFLCLNIGVEATIEGFTVTHGYADDRVYYGGGLFCEYSILRVLNCRFVDNVSEYSGAGACVHSSELTMSGCLFLDNTSGGGGGGGGMAIRHTEGSIDDCVFLDNYATDGGGLWITDGSPSVTNCLFARNGAQFWGGGIVCISYTTAHVAQCSFVGNDAYTGGNVWVAYHSEPTFENCVIAFSTRGSGVVVDDLFSAPHFLCCDTFGNVGREFEGNIEDPTGSDGNICSNPLFCEQAAGDYSLAQGSPCLPENNECGVLMGAFGMGCENATSLPGEETLPLNWGSLKSLY